ncbi:NAD(P)/FAD-dependent oxidoreductase [Planosporangium flavigriseum]|uniref:Monooxygenase n=1 Tax=Planosporangium flavigriseum TaxID=373681 RepID=A0A8J3LKL2_9ACTN|nr:monooxygenase [Planosporangium flavigriseum]
MRVHERGPELREIGAGIFLWENALRALEYIGAFEQVAKLGERVESPTLFDHRHKVVQREWLRHGRLYTVVRSNLHRTLADTAIAAGVEIVTNSRVVGATPDGTLKLEDGTTVKADVVVGADGVNSKVRDSLGLAKAVVDLKDGCGRHLIPRNSDDPVGTTIEEWHGGRRIGVVPSSPTETYIFLCCPESDTEGTQQQPFRRETWLKTYPHYASQIERIPDDTEGRWAKFYDVEARSWRAGRVAIIGDAAHAMSPNLGQAACVAMTNAVALGQALSMKSEVEDALRTWEASERPVVDRIQRYSRFYGWLGTHWPDNLLTMRSGLIWSLGRSKTVQRRINFAADHFPNLTTAA